MGKLKSKLKSHVPWFIHYTYRKLRALPEDLPVILPFLFRNTKTPTRFAERLGLVYQCYRISYSVDCPHMENEIVRVMEAIFDVDPAVPGVIVEAGSYKGGSGAKLSRAAALANRKLYLFDSFEGIPEHRETHGKNIYGGDAYFPPGSYRGSQEEVQKTIETFGNLSQCVFVKGWFDNTMPHFKEPVIAAYIDVDLLSSTRTCVTHLYPLLIAGGTLFSQDGHLPWIINLLNGDSFWETLHAKKPRMMGLGTKKLVEITRTK